MNTLIAVVCRFLLMAAVGIAACGAAMIAAAWPASGWILLIIAGVCAVRRHKSGWEFGTARAANLQDLRAAGLLGENGLILGRATYTGRPSRWHAVRTLMLTPLRRSSMAVEMFLAAFGGRLGGCNSLIRVEKYVHLATFAPTGRGKGRSVLIPNLLSYRGSCVVTDPKGELFELTARHRQREFGHRIVRLDPFAIGGPGAGSFNPLDLIDATAPDFLDQCRDLANALVVRTGHESEPHWNDSSELILLCMIAFVAAGEPDPAFRNLQTIRDLLSARHRFERAVEAMQKIPALQRQGHLIRWYQDKELGSVMSTVQRHTACFDSPEVAACTARSSFHPRELRSEPMTVYLILPPERLVSLAPLMRLWIGSILRGLLRGKADERNPVLFLIDEAAHLGQIQALEDAVTLMRGYGIRLWFFFQSVGQLTKSFGERAGTFLDNIDTQQYFGTNAFESAEAISKRIGDATIEVTSVNDTTSSSRPTGPSAQGPQPGSISTSISITTSRQGRALFKPDEVLRLREDMAIIFHRNLPPCVCKLVKHDLDKEFRGGGTGKPRLGLGAGLAALAMLCASVFFTCFAMGLSEPGAAPQPVFSGFRAAGVEPVFTNLGAAGPGLHAMPLPGVNQPRYGRKLPPGVSPSAYLFGQGAALPPPRSRDGITSGLPAAAGGFLPGRRPGAGNFRRRAKAV